MNENMINKDIKEVIVFNPLVIRQPSKDEFVKNLMGNQFIKIERFGKFLIFHLQTGQKLVINPMLAGKFYHLTSGKKNSKKMIFKIFFNDDSELHYYDSKQMGKIYLVEDEHSIPTFSDQGPDILKIKLEEFKDRIQKFRGQIKNMLLNQKFVRGIGNAYADEILFEAGIYPFRKRSTLNDDEINDLFSSSKKVLLDAINVLKQRIKDNIENKIRDFLKIHDKGGQSCPTCGKEISQVTSNKRITSYCKNCQK